MSPPESIVYSTNPQQALGDDGTSYILKGPSLEIVFAEAAAYELAALVGIDVPPCAIAHDASSDLLWFGSEEMSWRGPIEAHLDVALNVDVIPRVVAFDVWIANIDRNIQSFVMEPLETGVRFVAIDFEKAQVLRGVSRFEVTAIEPHDLWPSGDLATICREMEPPREFVDTIRSIGADSIAGVFEQLVFDCDLATVDWHEAAADYLESRADALDELVTEVWNHGAK